MLFGLEHVTDEVFLQMFVKLPEGTTFEVTIEEKAEQPAPSGAAP